MKITTRDLLFRLITLNSPCRVTRQGESHLKRMKNVLCSWEIALPDFNATPITDNEKCDYVPQGLCKIDDIFLISAYDSNHKDTHHSIIYVCDAACKVLQIWELPFASHVGGLAYDGVYLWVCSGGVTVTAFDYGKCIDLMQKNPDKTCIFIGEAKRTTLDTDARTSFCAYDGNLLWTGVFSLPPKYDGEPLSYGYRITTSALEKVITLDIPKKVQGICFCKYNSRDLLLVSQAGSALIIYDKTDNYTVPVTTIKLPCMLEQIIESNGYIYMLFESSANVYAKPYRRIVSRLCVLKIEDII